VKRFTLAIFALVVAACASKAPAPTQTAGGAPASAGPACKNVEGQCDKSIEDAQVMKVVKGVCWRCHADKGIAGHDFPDIAALRKAPVAYMVGSCQMPPDGNPLAEKDRVMLTNWASCEKAEGEKSGD
jgi:cytochrome c553